MAINRAAIQSLSDASAFPDDVGIMYRQVKQVRDKIVRYQAATDPTFNQATNAAIPAPDRPRFAALKPPLDTLLALLETEYADFIDPA